ncbi:hypothetical protein EON81_04455 [bacterium]|nr:MAG: hypothetical protein EON81_04455 [bacterium]
MLFFPLLQNPFYTDPPLPQPSLVLKGTAIPCAIEELPRHGETKKATVFSPDGSITFVKNGVRTTLPPVAENNSPAYAILFGTDGSYAIGRTGNTSTMAGDVLEYPLWHIRYRETEQPVGNLLSVAAYRDRMNYVAVTGNLRGYGGTGDAPEILLIQNGMKSHFGWGSPLKVWSLTQMLVDIKLDSTTITPDAWGQLSYLRYYGDGRAMEIGRFEFLGTQPDRTVIVKRAGILAFWRAGRFTAMHRLPKGWQALAVNTRGDVLLGRGNAKPWEEGQRSLASNWDFGIVRDGTFRKLHIPKEEKPLAVGTGTVWAFGEDLSFNFGAKGKYDSRPYRITMKSRRETGT